MRNILVSAAAALLALAPAHAQTASPTEAEWRAWAAETASKSRFGLKADAILADAPYSAWSALRRETIQVKPIHYPSGTLQITGFIVRPAVSSGRRPVLIWARGGIGNIEQDETQFAQMASWVERGYIVVGSNYRGSAGGEGKDEFAGADVDDLVALLPVIARTPSADPNRLFGIGFSRGGTMLLRAAGGRIPFRAIATAGLSRTCGLRLRNGRTSARPSSR